MVVPAGGLPQRKGQSTNQYLRAMVNLDRDVRLVLVAEGAIGLTVFGGVYSVLLNLYLLRMGFGTAQIGLVNGMGYFALGVFSLAAGAVGAWLTTRRAMLLGVAVTAASLLLLPLADMLSQQARLKWVLGTYLAAWMGLALYYVNVNPYVMAATTADTRTHAFSARFAIAPLAAFVGSILGGVLPGVFAGALRLSLNEPAAYRYPLIVAAVLFAPAALVLVWLRNRDKQKDDGADSARAASTGTAGSQAAMLAIVLLSAFSLLQGQGEGMGRTFFNVYLDKELRAAPSLIGSLSAMGQLLAAAAALLAPTLSRRWGPLPVVVGGTAVKILALLSFALVTHWGGAGVGFAALVAASAVARPAFIVLHQSAVGPTRRPAISGATTMAASVAFFTASYGGGLLLSAWGFRSVFVLGAAIMACAALLLWCVRANVTSQS